MESVQNDAGAEALPQALEIRFSFVRGDATGYLMRTWQPTLRAWASLLQVSILPPKGCITHLNLTAAARAIDIVMSGGMEPVLPRRFGYLRFFQFLESMKSRICAKDEPWFAGAEVVSAVSVYSIYAGAQVVASEDTDLRRSWHKGRRLQQLSIESALLLSALFQTVDTFAQVLSRSFELRMLTLGRDPEQVDENSFELLAARAHEAIPKDLQDVCRYLTTSVEEATRMGAPSTQFLEGPIAEWVTRRWS